MTTHYCRKTFATFVLSQNATLYLILRLQRHNSFAPERFEMLCQGLHYFS